MSTSPGDAVVAEATVSAPVQTVWPALREPVEIRRWFGWDYPGLDEEIEQLFGSATVVEADYVVDMGEGGRITLDPDDGERTTVQVTRPAPAGSGGWHGSYDEINEGWLTFLQQLRFALERHPGRDRRTIRLGGWPAAAEAPDPLAVLGLSGTSTFDDGRVLYAAEHQLGLTLPDHGDSLLVVSRSPADDSVTAVVSTYGLDDSEFERLRQQCTERWQAQYTDTPPTK